MKRKKREDDIKREICKTQPDWPYCKDVPKSKSDDPNGPESD